MISSTQNRRIVEARKLTQRKHRLQQGRFLAEGLQLLTMALQARALPHAHRRIKPAELFFCEALFTGETAHRLTQEFIAAGAEAVAVTPEVIATLSERDVSQGLVATFAWPDLEFNVVDLPLAPPTHPAAALIVILDQLQDPGNLGTLIRTLDAVGGQAVILVEPCVDRFDPKTVRSTMGSLFTVPTARTQNLAELVDYLSSSGYHFVGADGHRGSPPWQSDLLTGRVALVLGNEAHGLSREIRTYLNAYVGLPLRGQAESLNVAVAGGALMYEWLRINEPPQ
jgi:TrmH family RNA methyltransferase